MFRRSAQFCWHSEVGHVTDLQTTTYAIKSVPLRIEQRPNDNGPACLTFTAVDVEAQATGRPTAFPAAASTCKVAVSARRVARICRNRAYASNNALRLVSVRLTLSSLFAHTVPTWDLFQVAPSRPCSRCGS